jgi:hypothetical protein
MEATGAGTIRRIWMTVRRREPVHLRALRIDMYWDGAETPAVSAPMCDFFGAVLGQMSPFENELFSNPEGRSFCCFVPMPFRTGARITLTNESEHDELSVFYDVDFTLGDRHGENVRYFHAHWRRERWTEIGRDFEVLPKVTGSGRFLGAHIGCIGHPDNRGWFGEGEAKVYLDGDAEWPTLAGTGTEDYIGSAWGQGRFVNRYQGCFIGDWDKTVYTFYRYHIPDPIYFQKDCRATLQQLGGNRRDEVAEMMRKGVPVKPASMALPDGGILGLLDLPPEAELESQAESDTHTNYYRQDDVCAVAFFYLDSPTNGLAPLPPVEERTEGIDAVAARLAGG